MIGTLSSSASARRVCQRFVPQLEALENRTVPAITLPDAFQEDFLGGGLSQPTAMEFAPDGRIFVAEKAGKVRIVENGTLLATPFLTVPVNTFSERGLVGITLDPDFATNGFVYLYYTTPGPSILNRVVRFTADPMNPNQVLPGSDMPLLDGIPSLGGNHNGGGMHFGPDGKLYIAVGDSGITPQNAPKLNSLSGKILRINADGTIPTDNPFFNTPGARQEIFARGFRNPFTFAISAAGRILVNDVGQRTFEEIDDVMAGKNYGWPTLEGPGVQPGLVPPIYFYSHRASGGDAITGGVFYEDTVFPTPYQGNYFFADFLRGFIRRLDPSDGNKVHLFAQKVPGPVDLDVGPDGNLYVLSIFAGGIIRISPGANPYVAAVAPVNGQPQVRIRDASSGALKLKFFPYPAGFTASVRIAVGDVDGDGASDFITAPGAGSPPIIRVFHGLTGLRLPGTQGQFQAFPQGIGAGAFIAAADFDADGKAEIVVGAGKGNRVRVFSGADRSILADFTAYDAGFTGGVRVAVADTDHNGTPDIITAPGPGMAPQVKVFAGLTGTPQAGPLSNFLAYDASYTGGVYVAAGDLDGDDLADIITGPGGNHTPTVHVYRSTDGDPTMPASFDAYDAAFLGGVRVAAGDVNGDGKADIFTAPGTKPEKRVRIFDGATLGPPPLKDLVPFSPSNNGVFIASKR